MNLDRSERLLGASRARRLPFAVAAALCVLVASGCEGGADGAGARSEAAQAPRARASPPGVPDPEQAFQMPPSELRAAVERARERIGREGPAADGGRLALRGAELARLWSLRTGEAEGLTIAGEMLEAASEDRDAPGACEAALALARLRARDEVRLRDAHRIAYRTVRRFAAVPEAAGCVTRARRMTRQLDAHRPSADLLAAIDADPEGTEGEGSPMAAWAAERAPEGGPSARLQEVVVYGAGPEREPKEPGVVRVVLRFDRVAVFRRGEIPAEDGQPARMYLDFERTRPGKRMEGGTRVGAGGLEGIRIGRRPKGVTRVVFDMVEGARERLFFLTDPYRVVVDFERVSTAGPTPTARVEQVRTILLDPGHGGDDLGARNGDLRESRLTLDIARRVARRLERRLSDVRVLMTRHGDDAVSLEQRTAMANAADADLFVSIHLNAAEEPVDKGGVATFVLDVNNDEQALRLAARENGTSVEEVTGLQRILANLHRQDQSAASRRLAAHVHDALLARARQVIPGLPDRGVREAMFYVLVGARMPSVLVEASFLTQPVEAQMLGTDRYRQNLADGIAEGIQRYVHASGP